MEKAHELDLKELLDKVGARLKMYESNTPGDNYMHGCKQTCSYECRHFYKKLYFNPGLALDA